MQFGFGVLHLSSEAFWKMTPRELAHAITAVRGRAPAPIARGDFDALMKLFRIFKPAHDVISRAPDAAQRVALAKWCAAEP